MRLYIETRLSMVLVHCSSKTTEIALDNSLNSYIIKEDNVLANLICFVYNRHIGPSAWSGYQTLYVNEVRFYAHN